MYKYYIYTRIYIYILYTMHIFMQILEYQREPERVNCALHICHVWWFVFPFLPRNMRKVKEPEGRSVGWWEMLQAETGTINWGRIRKILHCTVLRIFEKQMIEVPMKNTTHFQKAFCRERIWEPIFKSISQHSCRWYRIEETRYWTSCGCKS